ncbi:MAG: hypothetical protein ACP5E3_20390, partial [Bacteroidales bacterium]
SLNHKLTGRWILVNKHRIMLSLNLKNWRMEWLNDRLEVVNYFDATGLSHENHLYMAGEYLKFLGMDIDGLKKPLHFQIPDYGINIIDDQDISSIGVEQWKFFRDLANRNCFDLLGLLQKESEIRIWPHHFDTGIYVQLDNNLGIGFGLAIKDSLAGLPYFYLTAYNGDAQVSFSSVPELTHGKFIMEGSWKGAILTLDQIPIESTQKTDEILRSFLIEGMGYYLK